MISLSDFVKMLPHSQSEKDDMMNAGYRVYHEHDSPIFYIVTGCRFNNKWMAVCIVVRLNEDEVQLVPQPTYLFIDHEACSTAEELKYKYNLQYGN